SNDDLSDVSDDDDTICLECTESYSASKPGEEWVQCITCKLWAHSNCAKGSLLIKYIINEFAKRQLG
ncbi:hypothetical protein HW555_012818, partial [Spodoptera exigua]